MKKVLLYVSVLFFVMITGCNNSEKSKERHSDSTNVLDKKDTIRLTATDPGAKNGIATIDNKTTIYKSLENTTIKVAYVYNDFIEAIDSWNTQSGTVVTDIYMVYAAYTMNDMNWYVSNHKHVTEKIFKDSILNQPCLLMGYPDPQSAGKLLYKEFGTICPPPTSCETFAVIPNKKKFFSSKDKMIYPGFSPEDMISNYFHTYDTDNERPLTSTVKFNIDSIKNLYKNAGAKKNDNIYFFMGAYDNGDAQRYVKTHPGFDISIGSIQDKTCLLFALFDPTSPNEDKYNYFDFGTICPPENSCKSTFK